MREKAVRHKALAYIVREGRLLVMRHTDFSYEEVGIQVPGGGIRPGEAAHEAAVREAREETGLRDFTVVKKLGEFDYDVTPYRFEIQRCHVFHLRLGEPTLERWASQEEHDGRQPPTRLECFWIPLESAHILQGGQGMLLSRLYD